MTRLVHLRSIRGSRSLRALVALGASASMVLSTSLSGVVPASADTTSPPNVPYSLPVALPRAAAAPAVDAAAPYTPTVLSLIAQLEPSNPPTQAELANASLLLHDGPNSSCHNVGPVSAPTGTTPSIAPICWTDAQGVLNTSGPNARGSTGPMTLMGLGASFDRVLGNAWGQTEGTESREFMVTGMFGPQTDLDRLPNWGRNLTTTGEDPYLSHELVAAQINGIQGTGAMSQMKHFAVYNGQNQNLNTDIQDQSLHELYLTPYEGGFVNGRAAATMCSYQIFRDTSSHLGFAVNSLWPTSPFQIGPSPQTWPLNESHYSCEQPLILSYILRDLWGARALVGSDYPATHSTSAILQGEDQEMPTQAGFFSASGSLTTNQQTDPTGSTCADAASGTPESCSTPGATHVGGIPGPGCPSYGCALVNAVVTGNLPLSVFNQSLARVLYQEERFGLLGCPSAPSCLNPGGVAGDRSGTAPLPTGSSTGTPVLGTKNGDAAMVEKYSEEGATLLKNDGDVLPITSADLSGGILVAGANANHTVADPTNEASTGFVDRDAINPLQQLKAFSGDPTAFTFVPANDPTGQPVPSSALSTSSSTVTGALSRVSGPGSPTTDATLDFTAVSAHGQLGPGKYAWTGYLYVPTADTYTFELQQSSSIANANVTFSLDGVNSPLVNAANVYGATVPGTPTNAGYTEALLTNRQFAAGSLAGGTFHALAVTFNNDTGGAASFRFAYSRLAGDITDAATAAVGKKLAIVFVNDGVGATSQVANPYGASPATISGVIALSDASTNLIEAVAAANPNTVVVLNTANPVLMPWVDKVRGVLEMWFAGQEGGTSTARLLLGLVNPSGHTAVSWPKNATDTIWGYNQTTPLYPGDTTGPHFERLNGNGGCAGSACPTPTGTNETEGVYTGYRFFDKQGLTPLFPFGFGLSYTSFGFSNLRVSRTNDGGLDVSFSVKNAGKVAGAEAAQVYVGPPSRQPVGVQFAVRSLVQFEKVELAAGQSQNVSLHVAARELAYWSEATQQWVLDADGRQLYVGDADDPANLTLRATINGSDNGNLTCSNEQLNATAISGNLTVAQGAWCDLIDVTVGGNVLVNDAGGVRIVNARIGGNLQVENTSRAADPLSSGANVICDSVIEGNLQVHNSSRGVWTIGGCATGVGNKIGGNLQFTNNAAAGHTLSDNSIRGNLQCQNNGVVTGGSNTVQGNLQGQCAGLSKVP